MNYRTYICVPIICTIFKMNDNTKFIYTLLSVISINYIYYLHKMFNGSTLFLNAVIFALFFKCWLAKVKNLQAIFTLLLSHFIWIIIITQFSESLSLADLFSHPDEKFVYDTCHHTTHHWSNFFKVIGSTINTFRYIFFLKNDRNNWTKASCRINRGSSELHPDNILTNKYSQSSCYLSQLIHFTLNSLTF